MSFTESPPAPPAAPGDGIARRRRIARELLTEAEAVGRLLDSNTAAIGTDETLFLKRLRSNLLARAEELTQMTDRDETPAPSTAQATPGASPEQASAQTPATEPAQAPRGALDLARIVVVAYLMFLFAFMGYLFAKSHLLRVDVSGEITDLLKVFVAPLLMLVLGFFFGTARR